MEYYDKNDKTIAARQIQNKLRSLSRWIGDPALSTAVDGSYDSSTADAVRYFQALYGLEATGVVDLITWEALDREYLYYEEIYSSSRPLPLFPDIPDFSLSQGDRGDLVLIVQIILNTLRIFYDTYGYIPPNGRYGTATAEAVREIQRIAGLSENGNVDRPTWNRLAREYDIAREQGGQ